jgi:hypothetical protein
MRVALSYLKVFGVLITLYLLFGAGAWLVPNAPVHKNVVKTLEKGDLTNDLEWACLKKQQGRMDNFTDALILNQALTMSSESVVDGVLLMPRKSLGGAQVEDLRAVASGTDNMNTIHYGRYWHGNTFLTRYLLLFGDYLSVRYILYILSSLLMIWCGVSLSRKTGWKPVLSLAIGLLFTYVYVMQFSVQLCMVLLIALGGMLAVAKGHRSGLAFFVIGSLTSYFDLLTAPLLTLGLPLVALVAVENEPKPWKGLKRLSLVSILWGVGYGFTWVFKWLLATLLTSENVIADGIKNLSNRAGCEDFSRWDALHSNLGRLPWSYIVILLVILVVLACIRYRPQGWRQSVQYLAIMFIPWLWYLFAANHSLEHEWFTFRAQAASVAAALLAVASLVDWKHLKLKTKKLWNIE